MRSIKDRTDNSEELRRNAEAVAREKASQSPEDFDSLTPEEARQMVHELRVHHIELEMQNEELRRAQIELDTARARYFDLYHLAPIGYVTVSEHGVLAEANLTAATMLFVARSALVNQPFGRFIVPEDHEGYYKYRKQLFDTGEPQQFELRMVKKDGTQFWARIDAIVSPDESGERLCRMMISDISDRKQAEEDHLRIEQLKLEQQIQQTEKFASLGVLAGGVAHDFNNLLGGIFGNIDLALEATTDDTVTQFLSKALKTIERARGLTAQLLTFAKGGQPVRRITTLIPFIQDTVQFALSGSNVLCRFDIPGDLWTCNIDQDQIGQVIDNLIINAKHSMPDGGTVELTARNISLPWKDVPVVLKGNYVKISIKDSGGGIMKENLPRIFDPFYATKAKGHGLGLATCYSIIHQHGGAMDVESEPGIGTIFHIYLPAADAQPKNGGVVSAQHAGSGTIVVMDDEEVMRDTLRKMLETLGYSVVCKNDGKEAINYLLGETSAGRSVKGVILDLTVPGGMGGKATAAEIRSLDFDVPLFAISGYALDPVILNPAEYGFTAGLCKPFTKSDLAVILERCMHSPVQT